MFSTWILIVPLLCKNLIAFIRISRRKLIHTGVKGFTAVSTVVFNKLRVLNRQKFPSRNFLSPCLPQRRNWNKVYLFLFFFSSPFSLWAVLKTYLYNVAMNWINWLNYMTNFLFIFMNTDLLFWTENSILRISSQKHFHFLLLPTSRKRNLFPQYNVPGLKMTRQWKDKYVIYRLGGS